MDKLCDENIRINFLSSFPCNIIFYWFLSDTFDECYNNTLVMRLACRKTQMVKSRAFSHALHCGWALANYSQKSPIIFYSIILRYCTHYSFKGSPLF